MPAIAGFIVLCVVASIVWFTVIHDARHDTAITCNDPVAADGSGTEAGSLLHRDALDHTTPASPGQVHVQVLNAAGQRGQAGLVTAALSQIGFSHTAPPANDPLYPQHDMRCWGQIRFGPAGASAARTLSLVAPCMQLIRDDRHGQVVDVAIGSRFNRVTPNSDAKAILDRLMTWDDAHQPRSDTDGPHDGAGPSIDASLLQGARKADCA